MTRREKRVGEILDRFLERLSDPSPTTEQMKSAGERVLLRLRQEAEAAPKESTRDLHPVRSGWKLRRPALAAMAAAVILAAIGSIAIR